MIIIMEAKLKIVTLEKMSVIEQNDPIKQLQYE